MSVDVSLRSEKRISVQCSVVLNKRAGVGENACFWENFKSY
jgi:hypothetical protein